MKRLIDFVAKRVASILGGLYKIRKLLHKKTLISIYYSQIHSHFVYMSQAWGSSCLSRLKILQTLQNKAMRTLFWEDYIQPSVHTKDLYTKYKILPIAKLSSFAAAVMIFKLKNGLSLN